MLFAVVRSYWIQSLCN